MSEKKNKQNNASVSALIATIIVAVAAVAAIVVLIVIMTNDNTETLPNGSQIERFSPTQEQVDECLTNAHDLVASNYEVIKLYITQGLPHLDEPYGNKPEDGIYTVDSDKYRTPEDVQNLLKSIYTEQAANKIWASGVYKTRYMKDGLAYTGADSDAAGVEKILGISADFTPKADYSVDWSSSPLEVKPTAVDKCMVLIYVNGASPNDSDVDPDNILTVEMAKENGSWRLTELVS